ncbi:fot5 transposase [Fusarium oxysporum f. sp. phaseoli]
MANSLLADRHALPIDDIWNFDETGFIMGHIMAGMVITGSERQGRPKSVQPGNREWITVIQAINAEGQSIAPFIIGTGQYHPQPLFRHNPSFGKQNKKATTKNQQLYLHRI